MSSDATTGAIHKLEQVFGKPSRNTIGSAVFQSDAAVGKQNLESFCKSSYKHFVGDAWESVGEKNWLGNWSLLYSRPEGSKGSIIQELAALSDASTSLAGSQLAENNDDPQGATQALQGVFDAPELNSVSIYRIGDTDAITGVLISGLLACGTAVALVFLMD